MMNNQFNTTNLNQHGIQMAQHVVTSPPQASAAVLSTFLNAQQQQQQQLAAAVAAGAIFGDPRQLQLNANTIDKNYYTTTPATMGTHQRFYNTAGPSASGVPTNSSVTATTTHQPNTILITNNFSHQQVGPPSVSPDHQRNIRIVTSTSNPLTQTNTSNMATTASDYQHDQHVYNLNNNKQLQHLLPQHLLSQSSFHPATTELLHPHFTTQTYPSSQQQQPQQNHAASSAIQMSHFYVSPENAITSAPINSNQKLITNISTNNVGSEGGNATPVPLMGNGSNTSNSTVVLDRINICINNLYTDTSSSSASNSMTSTPAQQPSPIIPAIQHKPVVENGPSLPLPDVYESNVLVIDEPDSTTTVTTPQTPPTTPESTPPMPNIANCNNINNNAISTTSSSNSPSTSYNYQILEKSKQSFASAAQNIEADAEDITNCKLNRSSIDTPTPATTSNETVTVSQSNILVPPPQTIHNITTSTLTVTATTTTNTPLTPPTPTSPEMTTSKNEYLIESKQTISVASTPLFASGEDVFIKRNDGRLYLGTVIDTARNQFLVRFDDKTEIWCEAEQMQKLGLSSSGNTNSNEDNYVSQPMCVACKRSRTDSKVEICERCGRGYHRKCTTETLPGSEIWMCKRCSKPMKLDESSKFSSEEDETGVETCFKLHYNMESLMWDDKHRTNTEQIYCYCGKSGKFDNNMLQCWRCLNWYHTHCTQKCKSNLLRGDCFFVFCCSVCNGSDEYLRRIQANWIDVIHLVLYNLSILKKHHKYHHLHKDINPYVIEKRKMLPVPKEWISMQEKEFLDKVKSTLNENDQLFMCGKEIKRDNNSFALRYIDPPIIIKFSIKPEDVFNDDYVFNNLKRPLLQGAPENVDFHFFNFCSENIESTPKTKRKLNEDSSSHDVYEFDDTSEDEIPIKHILDKVKKTKLSPSKETTRDVEPKATAVNTLEKMDVEDDNANDAVISSLPEKETSALSTSKCKKEQTPKKEGKIVSPLKCPLGAVDNFREKTPLPLGEKSGLLNTKQTEKSSRKRKAFTFSKASHLVDSSSDENSSSSSRGTSLDLIIPPPKNFLGQNNPFRIISPKKNTSDAHASTSSSKKYVSFGIFNTTALNFSSKLAALKSAGLFPKLSTSNLSKAAGQPRTVRTIKRRLSAKDITIGPNKEVRRRRTRRLSSNIEVISTTTINPIPTNFFPIQAKDLLAAAAASTTTAASLFTPQTKPPPSTTSLHINNNVITSTSSSPNADSANMDNVAAPPATSTLPTHGRRLRQRPQKNSPNTSRRSSVSSNQSSTSSTAASAAAGGCGSGAASQTANPAHQSHDDLKQTVNKYFGIVNRIESGEQFSIRAKRQLTNGQLQYLIEWGETQNITQPTVTIHNLSEQTSNNQLMEVSTTT